jgi:hypothetical protein
VRGGRRARTLFQWPQQQQQQQQEQRQPVAATTSTGYDSHVLRWHSREALFEQSNIDDVNPGKECRPNLAVGHRKCVGQDKLKLAPHQGGFYGSW